MVNKIVLKKVSWRWFRPLIGDLVFQKSSGFLFFSFEQRLRQWRRGVCRWTPCRGPYPPHPGIWKKFVGCSSWFLCFIISQLSFNTLSLIFFGGGLWWHLSMWQWHDMCNMNINKSLILVEINFFSLFAYCSLEVTLDWYLQRQCRGECRACRHRRSRASRPRRWGRSWPRGGGLCRCHPCRRPERE